MKFLARVKAFLKNEEGASGIEYALVAAMVAVAIAGFAGTGPDSINTTVKTTFQSIKDGITKK